MRSWALLSMPVTSCSAVLARMVLMAPTSPDRSCPPTYRRIPRPLLLVIAHLVLVSCQEAVAQQALVNRAVVDIALVPALVADTQDVAASGNPAWVGHDEVPRPRGCSLGHRLSPRWRCLRSRPYRPRSEEH